MRHEGVISIILLTLITVALWIIVFDGTNAL